MTELHTGDVERTHDGASVALPRTRSAFISYATQDKAKAFEITQTLEARGLACWIAPRDLRPGQEYGEEIVEGIRNARCLVLVLSTAANQSQMVRREVERAVSQNKPVFPIRVEEVLPARSLEFFVSATHWVDAWSGSLTDHAIKLADEIGDERRLVEVRDDLRRRIKRRQLPRQIAGALFVLVGIVVGYILSNRGGVGPAPIPLSAWMATAAQEAGVDLRALKPSQFTISVRAGSSIGPMQGGLVIDPPDSLDGIVSKGALEFRIAQRPWKPVVADPSSGVVNAALDSKELEAGGPLQLRLNPHTPDGLGIVGPLDFDINVGAMLRQQQTTAATTRTNWLGSVGTMWTVDRGFLIENAGMLKAIRIGTDPNRLTLRRELPAKPPVNATTTESVNYFSTLGGFMSYQDLMPFLNADTLYGQLELVDGTLGPVVSARKGPSPARAQ